MTEADWRLKVYAPGLGTPPRAKRPPAAERDRILREQANRCLYCELAFGTVVRRQRRDTIQERTLKVTWDHVVPFAFSHTNDGYVAACQVCNGIKAARMFDSVEAALATVRADRMRKGWRP